MALYDDPKQFDECEKIIKILPVIDVNWTFEGERGKEIVVGDQVTIKIKITNLNTFVDQVLAGVHSNKFPYHKKTSWYIVQSDSEDKIMRGMKKLDIEGKVHFEEI